MAANGAIMNKVPTSTAFDVFLSYRWQDREAVEGVAHWLRERGLSPFLDRWYMVPGQPWPQALEEILAKCRSVAVLIGPGELGPWQQREQYLALERQAHTPGFPVIPVLLPGSDPVLGFLTLNTWVDLRQGTDNRVSLAVLAAAIRGEAPGPDVEDRIRSTLATLCPYRGLLYFREEDAPFFFGREAASGQLHAALRSRQLVAVVGASGCGKSSVVRAGLVPLLRRDRDVTWEVLTLFPGDDPLRALAAAFLPSLEPEMTETDRLIEANKLVAAVGTGGVSLRDVAKRALAKQRGTDRVLLVVDQWEELYTLTPEDEPRRRFTDALLDAARHDAISVVLTLRGDFVGRALAYRPLSDQLQDAQVNVGPMNRAELEQAVLRPAQKLGLELEPGLAERILEDAGEEPGNLPLLEFVLKRLWDERRGGALTHEAYDAMGGLQGAVAAKADEVFHRMSAVEQEVAKRVFLQVVRPGERGEDTRRRARLAEIGEASRAVIQELVDERLLVTAREVGDEETLEVSHEALIRHWGRLRGWVNEDREFLLWHERFRGLFGEWRRNPTDEATLLRGSLLAEARRWLSLRGDALTPEEREFATGSGEAQDEEARQERERVERELAQAQALAAEAEQRRAAEEERTKTARRAARAQRRFSWILGASALVVSVAAVA